MIDFKIGDLVQVIRGENKSLIGHIHNIDGEVISVVRIQKDIDIGLLPVTGKYYIKDIMKIYKDEELRYAAHSRCDCGAGFAYAKGKSFKEVDCWECSDILTGRALLKDPECKTVHTGKLPFAFYEVKSEDQPSVMGVTTRPDKKE